jgi:hypothetical protein
MPRRKTVLYLSVIAILKTNHHQLVDDSVQPVDEIVQPAELNAPKNSINATVSKSKNGIKDCRPRDTV